MISSLSGVQTNLDSCDQHKQEEVIAVTDVILELRPLPARLRYLWVNLKSEPSSSSWVST